MLGRSVSRCGVRRVVVRRQQKERHGEVRHGIQPSNHNLAVKMIRVEHVTAHDDKRATLGLRKLRNFSDRIEASVRVARRCANSSPYLKLRGLLRWRIPLPRS